MVEMKTSSTKTKKKCRTRLAGNTALFFCGGRGGRECWRLAVNWSALGVHVRARPQHPFVCSTASQPRMSCNLLLVVFGWWLAIWYQEFMCDVFPSLGLTPDTANAVLRSLKTNYLSSCSPRSSVLNFIGRENRPWGRQYKPNYYFHVQ